LGKSKRNASQPPLDQMAFGKPNRPSTPIHGVISNHYGENAAQEIQDKYVMQHELVINNLVYILFYRKSNLRAYRYQSKPKLMKRQLSTLRANKLQRRRNKNSS